MASDSARDRELHRYYQPWLETFHAPTPAIQISQRPDGHVPQSSRDRTLAAFAQLGALRLGVQRGVVTLIDSKNQYILAEATRSLSLMEDSRHAAGDELWLGNAVLPRSQGLSQDALKPPDYTARGPDNDMYRAPALVINDFASDPRYKTRAYAGPGGVNFYAGVPLTTKLGHTIGAYSVSHNEVRHGLNAEELRIMVDMATIVMNHLETIRNDNARARGERLIRGIGAFIKGSADLELESPEAPTGVKNVEPLDAATPNRLERPKLSRDKASSSEFKGMTISDMNAAAREQFSHDGNKPTSGTGASANRTIDPKLPVKKSVGAAENSKHRSAPTAGSMLATDTKSSSKSKSQYLAIFERASKILRKSLGADGVVFLDASAANLSKGTSTRKSQKSTSTSLAHSNPKHVVKGAARDNEDTDSYSSDNQSSGVDLSGRPQESQPICEIISVAFKDDYRSEIPQISEARLRRLFRRSPQGKVYTFDSQGRAITSDVSSESGPLSDSSVATKDYVDSHPRRFLRSKNALLSAIPDARTVVFLPLWDFAKERWNSAALVWSSNPSKLMNIQDDLSYLTAFGNSIMNEIARLNLVVSDTAKATFLANISHELRSPLHGILGSIEFLHDSPLDDFQSSMVISVEICGKTLLDTVDHVLDFAKLNNLSKATTKKKDGVTQATTSDSSLTSHFDLAIVVEEAVDAVYAGQVFRTANNELSEGKSSSLPSSRRVAARRQELKNRIAQGDREFAQAVPLTLNIDNGVSWQVNSQPGAVRRIVMNLLGNSLKYTESGSISVSLEIDHSRDQDNDGHLHSCITVIDTGRGMSADFVKNHAFTAFSQEDSLASGTGLGLSIIRQIVDSLGGKIDLKSQKDRGTEVKIWLSFPLHEKDVPLHVSAEESMQSVLRQLQTRTGGMRFCILTPDISNPRTTASRPSLRSMPSVQDSVRDLVLKWFSMKVFTAPSMDNVTTDFFLYAEPPPLEYLLDHHGHSAKDSEIPVIILCKNAFEASSLRASGVQELTELGRLIEVIAQPVGPQKLAKVLQRCMQRMRRLEQPSGVENDRIHAPSPQPRPQMARSAASLDRMLTQKSGGKRPGTPRHNTSVDIPRDSDKLRHINDEARSPATQAHPVADPALPRVLVVDDNHINLQLLETMVRKAKHPYESATNGLQAVETYKKSVQASLSFKYILMDISMPVMNGIQATKEIRKWEKDKKITPAVTIIALTGMGEESSAKAEAKETGFDRFLSKPVKFKDLIGLLL